MNLAVVIPIKVTNRWLLRHAAHSLAKKHPEMVLFGLENTHAEQLFLAYARNNKIPVVTAPPIPQPPSTWWGKIAYWWNAEGHKPWDPMDHADGVMLFWDGSPYAKDVVRMANSKGKKIWLVRAER